MPWKLIKNNLTLYNYYIRKVTFHNFRLARRNQGCARHILTSLHNEDTLQPTQTSHFVFKLSQEDLGQDHGQNAPCRRYGVCKNISLLSFSGPILFDNNLDVFCLKSVKKKTLNRFYRYHNSGDRYAINFEKNYVLSFLRFRTV